MIQVVGLQRKIYPKLLFPFTKQNPLPLGVQYGNSLQAEIDGLVADRIGVQTFDQLIHMLLLKSVAHNTFSHQIKLPVFRILFVGYHSGQWTLNSSRGWVNQWHDFNHEHQNLEFQSFLSLLFQVMPLDAMQQKAKEFEETSYELTLPQKSFSKRIYHSTNSVTHTESNQQHTIFFVLLVNKCHLLPLC